MAKPPATERQTPSPAGMSPRTPSRRLSARLGVALSLGATAVLIAAAAWNLRLQRQQLTLLIEGQASETVEVIRGATRDAMLANDAEQLRRQIAALADLPEIDRIRVFDKQGKITSSSAAGEIGTLVDLRAEQCVSCHAADEPLRQLELAERSRTFSRDGRRLLGLIAPIRNEPACANAACHAHPAQRTILGVLDVQLPLDRVEANLASSLTQLGAGIVGTAIALMLLTWWLTWRMVLRPVAQLTAAAPRLAGGDFAAVVPEASGDELGELARAWNRMAAELGSAHRQLADWSQTLEARVSEKTAELERTHQQLLLVEKMASLGKLAASVAHELNNPLAGIATYSKLLHRRLTGGGDASGGAEREETARILKLLESEAMRCGGIVKNLLVFARTPGAHFAPSPVAPLVERVEMLVRHQFELQGVRFEHELAPDLPPLVCDAAQIQQLLLALVINALEATPSGGRVAVRAAAFAGRPTLTLQVSDTGRGIPPENLDRLFEPFFTTKEQGVGVGLGLAVAYGIVERHRGKISVDSRLGQGTTFTVELPLAQSAGA